MLFIEINDSLEKVLITEPELSIENLDENKVIDPIINIPINVNKYNPLSGSFAKEWTLSIIPDLTIKAPNKLKEKTIIESKMVQILSDDDLEDTLRECIKAVAANHGIKATFSTGSQNQ